MAVGDALVCPACGTRNRVQWEFCARCGEWLQDVEPTREVAATTNVEEVGAPSEAGSWVLSFLTIGLVTLAAVPIWRCTRDGPPKPDPGLFALPTRPTPIPSAAATPLAEGPGAQDFEAGFRLMEQGKPAEAVPLLARAVSAASGNARFRHVYAQALWASGSQEQALGEYAEAARLEPGEYGYRLARVYETLGRNEDAVRAYEQLLGLSPDDAALHESLGGLLARTGSHARAVPHLEAAARARPDDPVLQQDLAYALEVSGSGARAAELYRSILEKAPQAEIARDHLAELLYKEGTRDGAIALVQEGVRLDPQSPLLRRRLGSLLERAGRTREASAEYREYARLAPNAPDAKELADRAARLDGGGS